MRLTTYTGGFCATNAYLLETPAGNILIDAPDGAAAWLADQGKRADHLLLTHQHFDHVDDAAAVQQAGAKVHAMEDYSKEFTLEDLFNAGFGASIAVPPFRVDWRLDPSSGLPLELCGLSFQLFHLPGHAPDSVVFHLPAAGCAFVGDTLMCGGIGRTDLPRGGHGMLLDGIRRHLLTLPPETVILSGHGPQTTIGEELRHNPFL